MNNDLSDLLNGSASSPPVAGDAPPPHVPDPTGGPTKSSGGISGKEKEMGGSPLSELHFSGPTVEMDLPKEVAGVGVQTSVTSVKLPPAVQSMGVKVTGSSSPMTNGATIVLPLTDREIADGLKMNITSSFRWLSEWCVVQLKKLGLKKK